MIEIPVYLYRCEECRKEFDITHGMTERPEFICEACDVVLKKLISPETVVSFRGGGWTRKASLDRQAGIPEGVRQSAEDLGA